MNDKKNINNVKRFKQKRKSQRWMCPDCGRYWADHVDFCLCERIKSSSGNYRAGSQIEYR